MPIDDHDHHDEQGHHAHHGHEHDRGWRGIVRYARHAPRMWRSPVNDAVVALAAPARGEMIIDVGAGMGAGTVVAAATGAHVVAVEPTAFMRRTLMVRRMWQRARKRIEVADGAAESLPVADHSVDAIYAVNTMHHWVDPDDAVAEIARALASSGRIVLVDEDFDHPEHPEHERFASTDHDHPFTMVTADAMAERLRSAGPRRHRHQPGPHRGPACDDCDRPRAGGLNRAERGAADRHLQDSPDDRVL